MQQIHREDNKIKRKHPQTYTSLGLPNTDRRLKDREKGEKRKKERRPVYFFFRKSRNIKVRIYAKKKRLESYME